MSSVLSTLIYVHNGLFRAGLIITGFIVIWRTARDKADEKPPLDDRHHGPGPQDRRDDEPVAQDQQRAVGAGGVALKIGRRLAERREHAADLDQHHGRGDSGKVAEYFLKFQGGMTPPFCLGVFAFTGQDFAHDWGSREMAEMVGFCILGLFIYGLILGQGRCVYCQVDPPNMRRWSYLFQVGAGLPALPAA